MTSIPPYRIKVPLLLGGAGAAELAPLIQALGFDARVSSATLGVASATKMCRSVMIKGLEAMVIESFTTARHYGVEDAVIASLHETFPGIDWEKQGAYFFQRVIEHGRRRSEEVREVAQTVREAGLEPHSAAGTAERQAWVADLADAGLFGPRRHARLRPQPRLAHRGRPDPEPGPPRGGRPARGLNRDDRSRQTHHRPVREDTRLARLVRGPEPPALPAAAGQRRRALPCLRPRRRVPYAPERKYTPCDASKAQLFALRDHLGLRAQRHRAGHLPRCRQPRAGRRLPVLRRPRPRRRHRAPQRQRRRTAGSCTRPACAACASTSSSAWSTSRPRTS